MSRRMVNSLVIALLVIIGPILGALYSGDGLLGSFWFVLGGLILLAGAAFQPGLQRVLPVLAWEGSPRETLFRRVELAFLAAVWLGIGIVSSIAPALRLWLTYAAIFLLIALILVDREVRQEITRVDATTSPRRPQTPQEQVRIRYMASLFLLMLGVHTLLFSVERVWGEEIGSVFLTFIMGAAFLLIAIFGDQIERWYPLETDKPRSEADSHRMRLWSVMLSGIFLASGAAVLMRMISLDILYPVLLGGSVIVLIIALVDRSWRRAKVVSRQ